MKQPPGSSESVYLSLAVFAWNEEKTIAKALSSLFAQSVFCELASRGLNCEVVCVLNGCTDGSAAAARQFFRENHLTVPIGTEVVEMEERGKLNAWNAFVHRYSAGDATYLVMMDADIILNRKETLWKMVSLLEWDPETMIAVDQPLKDITLKPKRSLRDFLSLSAAGITRSADAQLCAQLYCIRSGVARAIYLPKDLPACEDGFIKELVCTDFLTRDANWHRIRRADGAEHIFEAYTSLGAVLRNQKRQVMGQTVIHLLIDKVLKEIPVFQRKHQAECLRLKDLEEPLWLRRLIAAHLARTRCFWRLCPTYVGTSFRRWRRLSLYRRIINFPAALASLLLALAGSFLAYRSLKQGCLDYWPKAGRQTTWEPPVQPHSVVHLAESSHKESTI